MILFEDIGTRIKAARKGCKLSLKETAALTGVSVSYLSDLERGRTEPSLKTLRKLHGLLDINLSQHNLSYDELILIEAWRTDDTIKILEMIVNKG